MLHPPTLLSAAVAILRNPALPPPPPLSSYVSPPPLCRRRRILEAYKPRASVIPPALDFTACPYMWPYCRQPMYSGALPLVINATVCVCYQQGVEGAALISWRFSPAGGRGQH